jgi:hypothetical protein
MTNDTITIFQLWYNKYALGDRNRAGAAKQTDSAGEADKRGNGKAHIRSKTMNQKQQAIQTRQIKEWDSVQAYTSAIVEQDETTKRISASQLVLHGLLDQTDVFLLNSQLADRSSDEQIIVLEKWFTWLEAAEKFRIANDTKSGYAASHLICTYLWMHRSEARKEVESI